MSMSNKKQQMSMSNKLSSYKPRGRSFSPGESGNPAGRPLGSRNQFSADFVRDLAVSWAELGPDILMRVAKQDPSRYLGVCASLIPRDVSLSIEQRLPGGLSPEDWQLVTEVMSAVKQSIPDASSRAPGEVLQLTLDALRAHSAKVVDSQDGDTDCTEKPR